MVCIASQLRMTRQPQIAIVRLSSRVVPAVSANRLLPAAAFEPLAAPGLSSQEQLLRQARLSQRLLAAWQLQQAYFHKGFEWLAEDASNWRNRPADFPETRYQQKGVIQGRPTVFLNFRTI